MFRRMDQRVLTGTPASGLGMFGMVLIGTRLRRTALDCSARLHDAGLECRFPQKKNESASLERSEKSTDCLPSLAPNASLWQSSVITSKAANGYHFKTGQRDWPSGTENVLPCRLLWWQVGFGAPASGAAFEHMAVVQ